MKYIYVFVFIVMQLCRRLDDAAALCASSSRLPCQPTCLSSCYCVIVLWCYACRALSNRVSSVFA